MGVKFSVVRGNEGGEGEERETEGGGLVPDLCLVSELITKWCGIYD